ncbi:MAG: hypothetical protein H6953_09220 [Chromatiaceae bacterium]|nr:hypothetical protein [Gammaproteobacteria bacterium]MCP5305616.1 hypothetical protein [Chromatiaceae bacterium]MCP5312473.1 hypothetical protein [Chromatiaceae bacterium]
MDAAGFITLVDRLEASDWRAVGWRPLRLIDDARLEWGSGREPDLVVAELPDEAVAAPFDWIRAHAGPLLADFYRTRPLTQRGFNRQVEALIAEYGAEAFAARPGSLPPRTLFVDDGVVLAETSGDARHRYGAYCELPSGTPAAAVADRVGHWLASGEAYATYLSMNVCRYRC